MSPGFRASVLAVAACMVALSGCGRSSLEMVPVEGVVAFKAAQTPEAATVYFSPVEPAPGLPRRPGTGKLAADGSFKAASFKPGDGLVPGKYRIKVECFRAAKGGGWRKGAFELPEFDVPAGHAEPVRLDLTAPAFAYDQKVSM
ncbi:MAG: hypothetical protein U0836_06870 [Pirellulales bacterium]